MRLQVVSVVAFTDRSESLTSMHPADTCRVVPLKTRDRGALHPADTCRVSRVKTGDYVARYGTGDGAHFSTMAAALRHLVGLEGRVSRNDAKILPFRRRS